MATPSVIGVDNGGTWIRVTALDVHGRQVWSLKKPSPPVKNLARFLQKVLRRFGGKPKGLAVGSHGVWKKAARRTVARGLQGLAKKIVVTSDVEAAWLTAFKSQGIVVIAGTGSIAYARSASGRSARAGGFGPQRSDEGSGYWIGKKWLESQGKMRPFQASRVRRIAALAPDIFRRARRGEPVAKTIVHRSQRELAALVKQLARQLRLSPVPVACAGSLFQDRGFARGFWRALTPLRVQRRRQKTDAATALAKSIM